jgi:electron transfer flavoprotein alpha subunit
MSILVIAEHDNNELKSATHHTVTAAQALGGEVHVLVAGSGCQRCRSGGQARIPGVSKVLLADNAAYAHQLAENMSLLIAELGKGYDTFWRRPPATART